MYHQTLKEFSMNQKHITILERESIFKLLTLGYSWAKIAKELGRTRSTIGREIKRNTVDGEYSPFKAQLTYINRKKNCGAKNILDGSILLIDIQAKLEDAWTPEQIAGRSKLEGLYNISFKTIYRAIKANLLSDDAVELLPRKGKVKARGIKEKRGTIPDKKMIEERPQEANDRSIIGHYESDTIVGADHKGAIMTYVCRKTRFLIAELMPDRKAKTFNEATLENFKYIPKEYTKTFTSDNGKEFSGFKELEKELGINTYFANPYHSWERGTNENTNGLLRRFFPKGTDFLKLRKEEVNIAVQKINNRPRKCLDWKTPHEEFWGEVQCCI
jgi:IS30 family transposase